ncbi:CDP-alcohol phosphatidyltransferase [Kriegella sp. EG-1]|nr:CDP-alcohol phosphatidyltransferase [Flavobacteriaceae bacterium EG-1]
MSKLPKKHQFIDLSDYGRPFAKSVARILKDTSFTPIDLTLCFVVAGFLAIICILNHSYWGTLFFLILKSILDAADGELARIKNTPSYTGRYLDSISDIILNLLIILSIWHITNDTILKAILAFIGLQLQGTLYNYYYVILRNKYHGDTTSRIFEKVAPLALQGEKQKNVDTLFIIYQLFYGIFDKIIYYLDRNAPKDKNLPNWFMTSVSIFGLGFQLLIIGVMLVLGLKQYIISFLIGYTTLIFVFIPLRKIINK